MENYLGMVKNDQGEIYLKENISMCPRGFSVFPDNNWLVGLNEWIRVNLYEENNFFEYHRDSQYCPSANERSILTGIIYLNENFEGGETSIFFFLKCGKKIDENHVILVVQTDPIEKQMACIPNFEQILSKIQPRTGKCLLMSSHLIHIGETVKNGKK